MDAKERAQAAYKEWEAFHSEPCYEGKRRDGSRVVDYPDMGSNASETKFVETVAAAIEQAVSEALGPLRDMLIKHEPIAYRDHSDAWIQCTCSWGGFGDSGEDWAKHFMEEIAALRAKAGEREGR
jgi:hypothetical protein